MPIEEEKKHSSDRLEAESTADITVKISVPNFAQKLAQSSFTQSSNATTTDGDQKNLISLLSVPWEHRPIISSEGFKKGHKVASLSQIEKTAYNKMKHSLVQLRLWYSFQLRKLESRKSAATKERSEIERQIWAIDGTINHDLDYELLQSIAKRAAMCNYIPTSYHYPELYRVNLT